MTRGNEAHPVEARAGLTLGPAERSAGTGKGVGVRRRELGPLVPPPSPTVAQDLDESEMNTIAMSHAPPVI